MLRVRKSGDRGLTRTDWLTSYHSFSFADYYDPDNMGFRSLRVINDDIIKPTSGFGTHGHRDMEIVTYILEGTLSHKDSLNNVETIKAGEVQRMTAGTGIRHSEFNDSDKERVRLLQIWILPEKQGLEPGYEQKSFDNKDKKGKLKLLVSRDGKEGSLKINQDADIYASIISENDKLEFIADPERNYWVQIATGNVKVNNIELFEGDGLAVTKEKKLIFNSSSQGKFLLFDLR